MNGFPSYCWRLLECKYRGEEISEHIEDATVYLDARCTESFEFLGAYPLLLELGAHAVCSLENMSSLDMIDLAMFGGVLLCQVVEDGDYDLAQVLIGNEKRLVHMHLHILSLMML
ncbi:hypothetical protein ACSBR2_037237 [Camellia fascicularis]